MLRSPLPVNFGVDFPTIDSMIGIIYQYIFTKSNVMVCMCAAHGLSRVSRVHIDCFFKQLINQLLWLN